MTETSKPGFLLAEGNRSTHATKDEIPRGAARSRRPDVFDSGRPIAHVARDLGIHHETLRKWVRKTEADEGKRSELLSSEEREDLKALRGEVCELCRANEIKTASAFFGRRARPTPTEVSAFTEAHRQRFGVEPICRTWDVGLRLLVT